MTTIPTMSRRYSAAAVLIGGQNAHSKRPATHHELLSSATRPAVCFYFLTDVNGLLEMHLVLGVLSQAIARVRHA